VTTTKRQYKRHKTSVPATVGLGEHTLIATTRDVSLGGLFIFTDAKLHEGAEIQVVLMLPQELGLPASEMVCCHGKIVRSEIIDGQHGIAATIERFQAVPQA
jgi:PilZ domain